MPPSELQPSRDELLNRLLNSVNALQNSLAQYREENSSLQNSLSQYHDECVVLGSSVRTLREDNKSLREELKSLASNCGVGFPQFSKLPVELRTYDF